MERLLHLISKRSNERIAINGKSIPDNDLIQLVKKYQPLIKQLDQFEAVAGITEFETLTAMAFDYFLMKKVDVAIIEVGLGGLLDSTNVAVPMLTGITTIGLDHTRYLERRLKKSLRKEQESSNKAFQLSQETSAQKLLMSSNKQLKKKMRCFMYTGKIIK